VSQAGTTEAEATDDFRWLIRVWALVAAFVAITLYWSHHVGIPVRDPHGSIFFSRIGISIGFFVPMLCYLVIALFALFAGREAPGVRIRASTGWPTDPRVGGAPASSHWRRCRPG